MDMEGGEQGEGGMYGESNMEIYNTICKIDSQWKFAVWLRELKQRLYPRGVGWGGSWEGGSRARGICIPVANPCGCTAFSSLECIRRS